MQNLTNNRVGTVEKCTESKSILLNLSLVLICYHEWVDVTKIGNEGLRVFLLAFLREISREWQQSSVGFLVYRILNEKKATLGAGNLESRQENA
jgi:hypothetical protein